MLFTKLPSVAQINSGTLLSNRPWLIPLAFLLLNPK
jgi:hypothetical protein